ncbi:hypothetical protein RHSIM_Rhsim05G0181900 [Rhododendron simsii]|uniref:Tyrosine-protein kinase catalytic domain-containing protein n=1 Tax=Rhododendron simsii TaxID=118357 RepID=A0A834LP02_RHOSS|nr:hypothetical protein RHSIM_Rhsim05G0181900 [Rhododendron simsii]
MGIQISIPKTEHISNKCMKFSLSCSKFTRCFSPSDTVIPNRCLNGGEGGDEDFRGRLRDRTFVAIKVLAVELESMRGEREFVSELAALSNIKHENLVKLRGCCVHGAERGYLAPEYAVSGHLSRKSDVYSFGVLLMEIVSGRPVMNFDVRLGEQYLVDQAWEMYKANTLAVLVDPVLNGNFPAEEPVRFLKVGLLCVQEMAKKRPEMSEVLKLLTDETGTSNVEISQPGLIPDLMDVKIRSHRHSELFSKGSTSVSTMSPGNSFT